MKIVVNTLHSGKMSFESKIGNKSVIVDASVENGGEGKGPSPKALLLTSLAGCTGMDIVSLLAKMRVEYDYFNILTEGEIFEEHPKRYTQIDVIYQLKGNNVNQEMVEKAINLSKDKYCGVAATLVNAVKLNFILELNGVRKTL